MEQQFCFGVNTRIRACQLRHVTTKKRVGKYTQKRARERGRIEAAAVDYVLLGTLTQVAVEVRHTGIVNIRALRTNHIESQKLV